MKKGHLFNPNSKGSSRLSQESATSSRSVKSTGSKSFTKRRSSTKRKPQQTPRNKLLEVQVKLRIIFDLKKGTVVTFLCQIKQELGTIFSVRCEVTIYFTET